MAVMGRPREFDRDGALHAAMLVFWRKGFVATSMSDLCAAMGIASPSLYAAFGSKEKLYMEAVERYNAAARLLIWDHIDDGPTVREGMRKLLLAAAEVLPGGGEIPPGCMVHLATVGDECPGAIPEAVREARLGSLQSLRTGLKRALAAGELPRSANVDRLARFFLGVVQGMAVQAHDGASRKELAETAELAMAALPAVPA